jgi:hypothetical protein
MNLKEAIARLRSTHEFQEVMKAAEAERPFLLPMDPGKPWEQQTAEAFYRSGQIAGFDFLFNFLRGK